MHLNGAEWWGWRNGAERRGVTHLRGGCQLWLGVAWCGVQWEKEKILRHRTRSVDLHVISKVRIVFSCVRHWVVKRNSENYGSLAQLVERHVYTVDVIGSIPVGPTDYPGTARCRGFCLPSFCLPGFSIPITRREGARREAHEDNPAGTVIPPSIKLQSTYIYLALSAYPYIHD